MHKMIFQKTAGSLLLAAGLIAAPLSAHASLTFQGVTFTFTQSAANVLTLEIDAAGRTGDWATATNIGLIQVKDIGSFTTAALSGEAGPPNTTAASLWTFSPNELNANGCDGGSSGAQRACFFAPDTSKRIGLADDMIFHFTYTGGTQNFSDPHLKLGFYNGNGEDKVGSLLSMNIPLNPVPEPETWGMFMMGLGILAFLARPRKT
ncbi:PEP-CTERM sorting domain-containing protein [Rugamonas apoptosis]|uniref:PEP-CTERM sorting domain-containing protein n=1 Tax=Rugamonas apoptosis TaxID=2758570 RepID=A0A7W2FD01_9BURK|nr:PEP-CTERM sorting domain-containing protein [Rugamonas apoptosis]MBA5689420.1 PEP-CTERM sorting domain-containing protein [Rugamonas apoptosis]